MENKSRIKALEEKQSKERESLATEMLVRDAIKFRPDDWTVNTFGAYTRVSISLSDPWEWNGKPFMSWAVLSEAARSLPPLPLLKLKGTFLSFRPSEQIEAMPDEKREREFKEETGISPFLIKFETFQGDKATVEWFTRLAGMTIEVSVILTGKMTSEIARSDIRWKYAPGEKYVEKCELHVPPYLHTIQRNGESVAQLESPIRWASGGPEYPNQFTLYFVDLAEKMNTSAADLADHVYAESVKIGEHRR